MIDCLKYKPVYCCRKRQIYQVWNWVFFVNYWCGLLLILFCLLFAVVRSYMRYSVFTLCPAFMWQLCKTRTNIDPYDLSRLCHNQQHSRKPRNRGKTQYTLYFNAFNVHSLNLTIQVNVTNANDSKNLISASLISLIHYCFLISSE